MTPEEFVRKLFPEARRAVKTAGLSDGIVPAVLAQVALETGWLRYVSRDRYTGRDSRNLFNIKATGSWNGEVVLIRTTEYVAGKRQSVDARFRAYNSYEESFADYCKLITGLPRYRKVAQATDPFTYATELQKGGYATDPLYASKIHKIIRIVQPIIERLDREAGQ